MIKEYDKRGGGHSQKEALKEAIEAINTRSEAKEIDEEEIRKDEVAKMLKWAIANSGWCDEKYLKVRLEELGGE